MTSALRISVGLNVALAVIIGVLLWRESPTMTATRLIDPPRHTERAVTPDEARRASDRATRPERKQLTPSKVAALEQQGISRDTLVSVFLEDFGRRYTERVTALQRKYAPISVPDRVMAEFSRQCERDRIRELKEVFGEDGFAAWDRSEALKELNRARSPGDELPMTSAEAEQAYGLQRQFDQKAKELQEAMEDGVADRADVGALQAQAQQALDTALVKLLGKERFDALRGNVDPATEVYRHYSDLHPTPEQVSAVAAVEADFKARQATLAASAAENSSGTKNLTAELMALSAAREQQLREIFGAAAYDTMTRQTDPTYKTLQRYADAWELKGPDIEPVYDTLKSFNEQVDRLRMAGEANQAAGQRVNWREINASIEQARQQTLANLQTLIGDDRLRRLQQNGLISP